MEPYTPTWSLYIYIYIYTPTWSHILVDNINQYKLSMIEYKSVSHSFQKQISETLKCPHEQIPCVKADYPAKPVQKMFRISASLFHVGPVGGALSGPLSVFLAQNFEVDLVMLAFWTGEAIFAMFLPGGAKRSLMYT